MDRWENKKRKITLGPQSKRAHKEHRRWDFRKKGTYARTKNQRRKFRPGVPWKGTPHQEDKREWFPGLLVRDRGKTENGHPHWGRDKSGERKDHVPGRMLSPEGIAQG